MVRIKNLRANAKVERNRSEIIRLAIAFTDDADFYTNSLEMAMKM